MQELTHYQKLFCTIFGKKPNSEFVNIFRLYVHLEKKQKYVVILKL